MHLLTADPHRVTAPLHHSSDERGWLKTTLTMKAEAGKKKIKIKKKKLLSDGGKNLPLM